MDSHSQVKFNQNSNLKIFNLPNNKFKLISNFQIKLSRSFQNYSPKCDMYKFQTIKRIINKIPLKNLMNIVVHKI